MLDWSTPGLAEEAARHRAEALTPDGIDALLADFRSWLEQTAAAGEEVPGPVDDEPLDLHTLLGQFTALRHEVNLQTKAVRAQQELNAETLDRLTEAVAELRKLESAPPPPNDAPSDDAVRAQLKTLIELHDALAVAAREVPRVRDAILPLLDELTSPPPSPPPSLLARLFGSTTPNTAAASATAAAARLRLLLESILAGYGMSLQRLERALQQHDLEAIPAVGQPFDPEKMEALEAVTQSGRRAGEVLEEVRRGYLWRGRVFRYAQVRVAKS
jgi:molecular chaperone GrpE